MLNYYNVKMWQGYRAPYKYKLESEDSPSWSDLVSSDNTGDYVIHQLLSYGDYSNACMVERSNVESFLDDYPSDDNPHMWEIFGSYGSHAILFKREWVESNDEIQEIFDFLNDYPLYNEDHYNNLTWESYLEMWDDYGYDDFIREIERKFDLSFEDTEILESISKDNMLQIYETMLSSGEFYYDEMSSGVTILTSNAVRELTQDDVEQILKYSNFVEMWAKLTQSERMIKHRINWKIQELKQTN